MDLSLTYVNENKICVKIRRGYPLLAKNVDAVLEPLSGPCYIIIFCKTKTLF